MLAHSSSFLFLREEDLLLFVRIFHVTAHIHVSVAHFYIYHGGEKGAGGTLIGRAQDLTGGF